MINVNLGKLSKCEGIKKIEKMLGQGNIKCFTVFLVVHRRLLLLRYVAGTQFLPAVLWPPLLVTVGGNRRSC